MVWVFLGAVLNGGVLATLLLALWRRKGSPMAHDFLHDRLIRPSVDQIRVSVEWVGRGGWELHVKHHHSGEDWAGCPAELYGPLAQDELLDVLSGVVWTLLVWPGVVSDEDAGAE